MREKLVETLKYCASPESDCAKCERWTLDIDAKCVDDLLLSAAIALEEKQATSDENKRWIPVAERLPENEKDVLIRAERKLYGIGKRGSKIASVISLAFHTDGKMNTEQSSYTWETDYLDAEYDEKADAYIIPEGWWESVTYSECFSAVCDVVTHWMPLPEPPKEVEDA